MKKTNIKEDSQDLKFLKKNLHKPVKDLSSDGYHRMLGTWSSSQLKDMIDDEELFIKKYIKKEVERQGNEAFDTGTYFHTGTLEPHKMKSEIVVYPGKTRYGKTWDAFQQQHKGKLIVIEKQKIMGDMMIKAVKDSPTSQKYLDGDAEVSLFVELVVWRGKIYAPEFRKVLTVNGWESDDSNGNPRDFKGAHKMIVKVRADTLGDDYVSDLKSTSGNARNEGSIRGSISKYKYDLSAALYLDMFSLIRPSVREFIWIFASKQFSCAAPWRASNSNIMVGRAKYSHAMVKLADCAQANWEMVDCLREAEPLPHERDWLIQKDSDLL